MPIRPSDLDRVRALPVFRDLSDDLFRRATTGAFLQKFPAGTTLLLEGDAVDFLYVLLDGSVQLGASWNDKETVLTILRPVSTFILAAVVLDAAALMGAETMERSDILMISGEALRRVMKEDAQFAAAVALELAGCYRDVVRTLKNQKLRGGLERLANYLLTQRARQGGGDSLVLPYEKRIIASLLGMTPENLSRAFAALCDYGVTLKGPQVTIARPVVLERLAKPSLLIDSQVPAGAVLSGVAAHERWPAPLREPSAGRG